MNARWIVLRTAWVLSVALPASVHAQDAAYDAVAAKQAWTLNCMGCHTPEAHAIHGKVPALRDSLGHFVRLDAGREFVMRVPGASNSALTDAELANVLNWLVETKNAQTRPADFKPFTAQEVAGKRRPALTDVAVHRAALIDRLHATGDTAVAKDY
jgi:mono/diheme cytochrome c family protein